MIGNPFISFGVASSFFSIVSVLFFILRIPCQHGSRRHRQGLFPREFVDAHAHERGAEFFFFFFAQHHMYVYVPCCMKNPRQSRSCKPNMPADYFRGNCPHTTSTTTATATVRLLLPPSMIRQVNIPPRIPSPAYTTISCFWRRPSGSARDSASGCGAPPFSGVVSRPTRPSTRSSTRSSWRREVSCRRFWGALSRTSIPFRSVSAFSVCVCVSCRGRWS